ncbi:MAG: translation initiation factor IF-2 subunit alpha [Candidatus Odinarchaeum yellowstonii]|uniref:Translation initiation factor 2 subunit alpha n=1 Tax=Odinarchaeota yellowstonii (strain LCB_4) TaxID=1841599 RepID=A0AAF0D0X0_ODILC|nr:MAG: translation initiation factor IF-2 subunit alpha [Candidatus Odinarchaeum yellowstonii]
MVKTRREVPSEGDLLLCTVTDITSHGAYAELDEYPGLKGFIHLSEIASSWIKNIRNFVKEGQKIVTKVLKVNKEKKQIDLSLRRVTEQQKREKIQAWKRAQNAEGILRLAANKLGKTLDEAYQQVGWRLEDKYGEIYTGLQEIKKRGLEALKEAEIPEEWRDIIYKEALEHVEIPTVKMKAQIEVTCYKPDGVDSIKKSLIKGLEELKKEEGVKGRIFLVGSPRYQFEIEAPDYKTAERVLTNAASEIIKTIKSLGGEGNWKKIT